MKVMIALALLSGNIWAKTESFSGNIDKLTMENENFRKVIHTAKNIQLVLMSLKPGEDIGEEVHETTDQFLRVEGGTGQVVINGEKTKINEDDAVIIPAGATHNVINTGKALLQFYTLYSPPEHKDKTIDVRKKSND
jgi:mannose-6-phosphate isomerase-like protein (cupin superfamily)